MDPTTGKPGDLTKWSVRLRGQVWGADGETVWPKQLAERVARHEGEQMQTYYKKPYILTAANAQSVYDYFDSEIDPRGERGETLEWEATPPSPAQADIVY